MALTTEEQALIDSLDFDRRVCEMLKRNTSGALERVTAYTAEYEQMPGEGLSIAVERQGLDTLISLLRAELTPLGYQVFWSEIRKANGLKKSEEIVVLRTADHYSIIEIRHPSGANYDVSTNDLMDRLKGWEASCQFQIVGAASSWVAIQFDTLPENICRLAEEIYQFCPDTVDQGVGLTRESDDPETFEAARRLCPQLSDEAQQKIDKRHAQLQAMDMPPGLRQMLNSGGFDTSTDLPGNVPADADMGIRLLAYDLKQSKYLFLWWD